jgi:hypothetical protein
VEVEHGDKMVMSILLPLVFTFILPYREGIAFVFKIYYTTIKNEVFYEERRDMYTNPQIADLEEIAPRNHCK